MQIGDIVKLNNWTDLDGKYGIVVGVHYIDTSDFAYTIDDLEVLVDGDVYTFLEDDIIKINKD